MALKRLKVDESLDNRKFSKRNILLIISLLTLLVVLVIVFARASIEVGEERWWIFAYLFFVPVPIGTVVTWSMAHFSWRKRAGTGLITIVFVAVLIVQIVLLADRIYENPKAFRSALPVIIGLEASYLSIFPSDPERIIRHEKKAERWSELENSNQK